jgi:hypothetical protein
VATVLGGGSGRNLDRRGNYVHQDLTALLVLTQPSTDSCVRLIDGSQPELSPDDTHEIMLLAPYSLIGNVNMSDRQLVLPPAIFGREPQHGWCWYYQKASLARQNEGWYTVVGLGEEAAEKGLVPSEAIEWMPFVQAYVVLGDLETLQSYVPRLLEVPFVREQACSILGKTAVQYQPDDLELKDLIEKSLCMNGETE